MVGVEDRGSKVVPCHRLSLVTSALNSTLGTAKMKAQINTLAGHLTSSRHESYTLTHKRVWLS